MEMVKMNLAIAGNTWDAYLTHLIEAAQESIAREGIILTDTMECTQAVVMYAAYLYRKRDSGEGMPRMLRYALNNLLFAQKAVVT